MASEVEDGGPAFPVSAEVEDHGSYGMTKLEVFAAIAMLGYLTNPKNDPMTPGELAHWAFFVASGMVGNIVFGEENRDGR